MDIDIKKEHKYPNEIMIIPNKEKSFHEKWFKGRNMLNFPHPYRILLCSIQPNLGKTNIVKNIILRANPKFKEIFLLHCGEDIQTEYDDIEYECISSLPEINSDVFDSKTKTLLIIEDKNFKYMSRDDLHRLDRCYGFISTHRNLSIICCSQSFFDVPCSVRRMSNIYVLWKSKDLDSMKTIGRRCGLKKEELYHLIHTYLKDAHDQLWIDCTKNSPYPIRLNGFTCIDEKKMD
jgi:hypothetical protein